MLFFRRRKITWIRPSDAEIRQLQSDVLRLQTELDAEQRRSAVKDAEIEAMAEVIVRDRERVKAETAEAVRRRAESEGRTNERAG